MNTEKSDEDLQEELVNPEGPVGKDWKEEWRAKEKDPSKKRETRQAKKAERRRLHKQDRKNAKNFLRDWNS